MTTSLKTETHSDLLFPTWTNCWKTFDCSWGFFPKIFPCVHIRADAIEYFFLNYQMLIAKPELYYSNFSSSGRSCFQKSFASSGRELLVKKFEAKIQVQVFQILGKCPATESMSSHQSLVPQYVNHPTFIISTSQLLTPLQYSSLLMKRFQMPYLLQFKDPKSYYLLQTLSLDRILTFWIITIQLLSMGEFSDRSSLPDHHSKYFWTQLSYKRHTESLLSYKHQLSNKQWNAHFLNWAGCVQRAHWELWTAGGAHPGAGLCRACSRSAASGSSTGDFCSWVCWEFPTQLCAVPCAHLSWTFQTAQGPKMNVVSEKWLEDSAGFFSITTIHNICTLLIHFHLKSKIFRDLKLSQ